MRLTHFCLLNVPLRTTAAECLTAILISCGGFITSSTRSLIDSVAATGLSSLETSSPSPIFDWSSVKVAFLNLASNCLTTPWADGAASSIASTLSRVARQCEKDSDFVVSVAAMAALRLCDLSATPRAPALVFVTRATTVNATSAPQMDASASSLIDGIRAAREETIRAEKEQEKRKAEEKNRKEEQEQEKQKAEEKRRKEEQGRAAETKRLKKDHAPIEPTASNVPAKSTEEVEPNKKRKDTMDATAVSSDYEEEANMDIIDELPEDSTPDETSLEEGLPPTGGKIVDEDGSDEDEDFPDIAIGGGPDSDDE
jgi:flagellar biosynthesis GTPase FlhF